MDEYVKDLSLGRTSQNILAPAVLFKDVILMTQDYILRIREIIPEFGKLQLKP